MSKPTKQNSIKSQLRLHASELVQQQLKVLGVNRKDYQRLLDDASFVAKQLDKDYPNSEEANGSAVAIHHQRRLAFLRATPRRSRWEPGRRFDDGDPIEPLPFLPDEFPGDPDAPLDGFPPDGRPFDDKPVFPEINCFYAPVATLDTARRHAHETIEDEVSSEAAFTDDLSAGVNLCHPSAAILSLISGIEKQVGFRSSFRFNFTPVESATFRFKPVALVNGHYYTYEQSGISGGVFVGPQWSITLTLTIRISQFLSGVFTRISRTIFSASHGDDISNDVIYDSSSDAEAEVSAFLEANQRAHCFVSLTANLRSLNSFPHLSFVGKERYFKVPEIYVDRRECHREGLRLVRD